MTVIMSVLLCVQAVCKGYQQASEEKVEPIIAIERVTHELIWIQTLCKVYQQMRKNATSKKRVKPNIASLNLI